MSKIYTPFIFITTSYFDIVKIVSNRDNGIKSLQQNNSGFLITPNNNKYLQSLECDYGYTSYTPYIKLKFCDVDNNFENEMLATDPGSELIKALKNTNINIDKLTSHFRRLRIFCCFGIGTESKNWCDPFVAELQYAEIKINSNNVRTYEYEFLGCNSEFFKPRMKLDEDSPDQFKDLSFANADFKTYSYIGINGLDGLTDNPHKNISTLVKKFIAKAASIPEGNVITLLPKLNDYFKAKVAEYIRTVTEAGKPRSALEMIEFLSSLYGTFGVTLMVKEQNAPPAGSEPNSNATTTRFCQIQRLSPLALEAVVEDQKNEKANYQFILIFATQVANEKGTPYVNIPDWWQKLDEVSLGYSYVKDSHANDIVAIQQTNCVLSKILKDNNLIENQERVCVIVGDEIAINEYVYRVTESPQDFTQMEEGDEIVSILKNQKYLNDIRKLLYKNKSNSSFDEEIIVDELQFPAAIYDANKDSFEEKDINISNFLNDLIQRDIPLFLNNTKNGNILGLDLSNDTPYTTTIIEAVSNDRTRFFCREIDNSQEQLFRQQYKLTNEEFYFVQQLYKIVKNQTGENRNLPTYLPDYETNSEFSDEDLKIINEIENRNTFGDNESVDGRLLRFLRESKRFDEIINRINLAIEPIEQFINRRDNPDVVDTAIQIGVALVPYAEIAEDPYGPEQRLEDLYTYKAKIEELKNTRDQRTSRYRDYFARLGSKQNTSHLMFLYFRLLSIKQNTNLNEFKQIDEDTLLMLVDQYVATNALALAQNKGVVASPNIMGASSKSIQSKIYNYAFKNNTSITIKTLPFFHLATVPPNNRVAYLISKKIIPISIINSRKFENREIYDFFSGLYMISGHRHVITTKEMYSEFLLTKNIVDLPTIDTALRINNI